jgi:hypothetical protein
MQVEPCVHRWEDVTTQGGKPIAKQCVRCTLVVDLLGNNLTGPSGTSSISLVTKKCACCTARFSIARRYAVQKLYCGKKCRWRQAHKRRKQRNSKVGS